MLAGNGVRTLHIWALVILSLVLAVAFAEPALAAPVWLAPSDVSGAVGRSTSPQVGLDAAGDAVAVWSHNEGKVELIQAASRALGADWQPPVNLSIPGNEVFEPQLAVDPKGDAVVVWGERIGELSVVQAVSRPAGGSWSGPVEVSAVAKAVGYADVSIDASGNAVAAWILRTGGEEIQKMEVAVLPAGGTWQQPITLVEGKAELLGARVAAAPSGEAVAVWSQSTSMGAVVFESSKPANGVWQEPHSLSEAGHNSFTPDVAVDSKGDALVAWTRQGEGQSSIIQVASRPGGGAWQQPPHDLTQEGFKANSPDVAIDAAGNALVAWERSEASGFFVVQASSKPAGGDWGPNQTLSPLGTNAGEPRVALLPNGDALAVWERAAAASVDVVQAARRPGGGTWLAPVDLSSGGMAGLPQLAIDAAGDALATWGRAPGPADDSRIQAAFYDATAPQLRSLSIPAAGVVGQAIPFSVAPFDALSAVRETSWSFGDAGTAVGDGVTHTFASPGTYAVKMTATDAAGNAATASGTVAIAPRPRAHAKRVLLVRGGRVILRLRCGAVAPCAGQAQIFATPARSRGAHASARKPRAKKVKIASAAFAVAAGRTRVVKLPLTRKGRAWLAAAGRNGLRATLGGSGVTARGVVLKPAPHKKSHRHG